MQKRKIIWKEIPFYFVVLLLFGAGFILIISGINIMNDLNTISFGIAVFSAGIGIISFDIALISLFTSKKSDLKMQSIANASFFELTHTFEDRGIPLYNGMPDIYERDTISWRLLNYFQQANELKRWVNSDIQKKLVEHLQTLIEKLFFAKTPKAWVEFKNLLSACKIAIQFDIDDETKDELIYQLGYWLGYKNKGESNEAYLERKAIQMKSKRSHCLFGRHELD